MIHQLMKRIYFIINIVALATLTIFSACDDSFQVGGLANNSDRLVIEGRFTNENRVQIIHISRTEAFTASTNSGRDYPQVTGAQVTVTDDQGNTITFVESTPGVYATATAVQGVVGRSYTLNITTSDGKQYVSEPEQMQDVVPIKALTTRQEIEGDDQKVTYIELTADDPKGVNNYYQWHWKKKEVNLFAPIDTTYSSGYDQDRVFDGTELKFDIEQVDESGTRFIRVYQSGITQKAYDFLRQIDAQQNSGLGPFSPPPSPVRGNITNKSDVKDFALGYFIVASVVSADIKVEQ